ncbi:hypothetical protein [Streptomyces sp. NPDC002535]
MDGSLWLILVVVLLLAVAGCAAVLLVRVLRTRRLLVEFPRTARCSRT